MLQLLFVWRSIRNIGGFMSNIVRTFSQWTKKHAKTVGTLSAGVIIGGAGAAIVSASIPDANGVIHGCIRNNGDLRIIDSATQQCSEQQTPLNFNQTGPQGPQGPQGPAGSGGNVLVPDLAGKNLRRAVMVGWDLHGLDFSGADMRGAVIGSADVTGASFAGVNFESADLFDLDLAGFNLQNVHFGGQINNVNFDGADLTNASLIEVGVSAAEFGGANFTNAVFRGEFADVDFTNANFSGVEFQPRGEGEPYFTDVDFTGTDLSGLDVSAVVWANATCPDGTNSDAHGDTCVGHLTP
jgi:uncharacterized protein YjbI with pentapeptide repeats